MHLRSPLSRLTSWPIALTWFSERVRPARSLRTTDAEGAFTLVDVPAGVHIVRAWKERRELAHYSDPAEAGSEGVRVVVPAEER